MNKSLKIILLILIIILSGAFVFYYSSQPKSSSPPLTDESKEAKLREMSQSLTIQEQTPQFKAKLEEMLKSFNK